MIEQSLASGSTTRSLDEVFQEARKRAKAGFAKK